MLTLINAMQLKKPEIFMLDFSLPLERTCFPWAHLQGQTENITKIQNQILLPLKQHLLTCRKSSPNFFPSTKFLLFHGIRSSGKTFMAKTLGAELKRIYWDTKWKHLQTHYIHATHLVSSTIDDTKNKMSRIFQRIQQQSASNSQPSFIIIDDLHKLFSSGSETFNSSGGNVSSSAESYSNSPSPAQNFSGQDRLILDHLCTCLDHLKGESGRGSGSTENSMSASGQTYVVLIMKSNTSAPLNFLQLQDYLDVDLSLPFYTMDKKGRLGFFQSWASSLNPCPVFQLAEQTLDFLVQNTLGFTSGDLFKLKNLAVVQASAAAAKKLASRSHPKWGKGQRSETDEVGAEDWLRALHHFHSHGQSGCLQNILLTPSHQISMNLETAYQILSCPDVLVPLLQQNFDVIVNLIRSKIRLHDKMLKGSESNSRSRVDSGTGVALPFNNLSSSSAGLLINPQDPSYFEDPGLPSGSELSLPTRILYLHLPSGQSQSQGEMSMEFVDKYLVPAVVTKGFPDVNMPSFVIHGEAVLSQNIPPFVIINMLKEARQFESPCFLLITSLHLLISNPNPKFKDNLKNFAGELSKCAHNCGSSSNIFIIATGSVDISKLPPCLQDIFHGYQNCYRVQNTSEQEIQDFLHQAFFEGQSRLIPLIPNPECQLPEAPAVEHPSESPLVTPHNSDQLEMKCEDATYNNNVNNSLINLSMLLSRKKSQNEGAGSSSSGGKTVTTIKGPSAGFSQNESCNDTSVLQSRRETSRRKLSNNNPQHSETEQVGSPSNKIMRLDPNTILDRAVAVAVKMNHKSIIWFYEDLMRVKRGGSENAAKVLKHQEQIVNEAQNAQKPPRVVGSRNSSRNLSASSRSTNQKSAVGKKSNHSLSKTSPSPSSSSVTRNTRKTSKSNLTVEANNDNEAEESDNSSSDGSATTDDGSDEFPCD